MVEISFEICLENISIQSLFGREFPFTDCLVANFSSDIYIWVESYLQKLFGRDFFFLGGGVVFFRKYFLVGVSFEHCFVEISLKRFCGRNCSSISFLVEVSAGICLA